MKEEDKRESRLSLQADRKEKQDKEMLADEEDGGEDSGQVPSRGSRGEQSKTHISVAHSYIVT